MTTTPKAPAPSARDEREAFEQWRADRAEQKRTGGKFVLTVEGRAMARDIFANDAGGWLLPLLDEVERLEAFVAALTSQPPAVALVDERREPAVLRHALRFAEEIIKGQARYIDGPDMYIDAEHLAENLRAALSPSGAESLGVKEQSQEVHPVASSSGSLPLGITAELLEDALQVLRMVDDNHRVDAGERRKAWGGRFVVDEVRRVLTKGGA